MYKLHLSSRSKKSLQKTGEYLLIKWDTKVLVKFIDKTKKVFDQIKDMPESFPEIEGLPGVRRSLITKHNSVYYRIIKQNNTIQILDIIDTRQKNKHPKKLIQIIYATTKLYPRKQRRSFKKISYQKL